MLVASKAQTKYASRARRRIRHGKPPSAVHSVVAGVEKPAVRMVRQQIAARSSACRGPSGSPSRAYGEDRVSVVYRSSIPEVRTRR